MLIDAELWIYVYDDSRFPTLSNWNINCNKIRIEQNRASRSEDTNNFFYLLVYFSSLLAMQIYSPSICVILLPFYFVCLFVSFLFAFSCSLSFLYLFVTAFDLWFRPHVIGTITTTTTTERKRIFYLLCSLA